MKDFILSLVLTATRLSAEQISHRIPQEFE